jgi:hypothetical protein
MTLVPDLKHNKKLQTIKVADIDIALQMIKKYLKADDISQLVAALEMLKTDTRNKIYQEKVTDAFHDLGPMQGAALTYAPYLNIFVSDDPFED